ncbi:MAG: hypothetical protein OYL92_01250 [Acidobacteriota bacterium]|nr:hypothetical protein [Acidobacteriota bacterium]MDE3263571.1 hypothetical protein [Acidobacteriota bacterium]
MNDSGQDGLYVGYLDETPPGVARFARQTVVALLLATAVLGAGLALLLEGFDEGVFEYGLVREYEGELLVDPLPRLLTTDGPTAGYLLVGVGKRGLEVNGGSAPPSSVTSAQVSGTLIENPEAAMLEVHSLELTEEGTRGGPTTPGTDPAPDTETNVIHLRGDAVLGEIVDTKCYLGAMKPGRGKPHRDCASLCIRGGIPAGLLVRTESGDRHLIHLLNRRGEPMGPEVLEWVGEPVEVTGTLESRDNRLLLRAFLIQPTRIAAPHVVPPARTNPTPATQGR